MTLDETSLSSLCPCHHHPLHFFFFCFIFFHFALLLRHAHDLTEGWSSTQHHLKDVMFLTLAQFVEKPCNVLITVAQTEAFMFPHLSPCHSLGLCWLFHSAILVSAVLVHASNPMQTCFHLHRQCSCILEEEFWHSLAHSRCNKTSSSAQSAPSKTHFHSQRKHCQQ